MLLFQGSFITNNVIWPLAGRCCQKHIITLTWEVDGVVLDTWAAAPVHIARSWLWKLAEWVLEAIWVYHVAAAVVRYALVVQRSLTFSNRIHGIETVIWCGFAKFRLRVLDVFEHHLACAWCVGHALQHFWRHFQMWILNIFIKLIIVRVVELNNGRLLLLLLIHE